MALACDKSRSLFAYARGRSDLHRATPRAEHVVVVRRQNDHATIERDRVARGSPVAEVQIRQLEYVGNNRSLSSIARRSDAIAESTSPLARYISASRRCAVAL